MIDKHKLDIVIHDCEQEMHSKYDLSKILTHTDNMVIDCYKRSCLRDTPKLEFNESGDVVYHHNIVAEVHKRVVTEAITKAIIDYAVDNKIDELYLIDEDFVKTALENEIKRRMEDVTD